MKTVTNNTIQQQHDLARVGEGGGDRKRQKGWVRIRGHTKMLGLSDKDTKKKKKSIRINKHEYNS